MSMDCLAVCAKGQNSDTPLKSPVIRTLNLDVFRKLPPSWKLTISAL